MRGLITVQILLKHGERDGGEASEDNIESQDDPGIVE